MKKFILIVLILGSLPLFAHNEKIVCDDKGFIGLGGLTRIEIEKTAYENDFLLSVFKEVSCKDYPGCKRFKKKDESMIILIESPTHRGSLVSPKDFSQGDIKINFDSKKCKVHLNYNAATHLIFNGKIVE